MLISLTLFSGISFTCFGLGYLFSPAMRLEFQRYGLARFRGIVAGLQLAEAIGQLIGLICMPLATAAAASLALMMLCAIVVRIKIGDSLVQTLPAAIYLLLNLLIISILAHRFSQR